MPASVAGNQVDKRTIVDRATFQTAFKAFTHGVFEGFDADLWDNVLVAGGAVLASLLPLDTNWQRMIGNDFHTSPWAPLFYFVTRFSNDNDPFSVMTARQQTAEKFMKNVRWPDSDVDIFIYGLTSEAADRKVLYADLMSMCSGSLQGDGRC